MLVSAEAQNKTRVPEQGESGLRKGESPLLGIEDKRPEAEIQRKNIIIMNSYPTRQILNKGILQGRAGEARTAGVKPAAQRRIPQRGELLATGGIDVDIPEVGEIEVRDKPDAAEHRAGLRILLKRKLAEMRLFDRSFYPVSYVTMLQNRISAIPDPFSDLEHAIEMGSILVLSEISTGMTSIYSQFQLGDPAKYKKAPATPEEKQNLRTLVTAVDGVFGRVTAGGMEPDVKQVFGDAMYPEARARMVKGRDMMNRFHTEEKILTDRSGTSAELNNPGLTFPGQSIFLDSPIIDNPGEKENKVTLFHESMHAGNPEVLDEGGYHHRSANFIKKPPDVKIANASHFEELARRDLDANPIGGVFDPFRADPSASVSAPPGSVETQTDKAMNLAYIVARRAWTNGLGWHVKLIELYNDKSLWNVNPDGPAYSTFVPQISDIIGMTVHKRGRIDATSADPAKAPITQIDLGLSETVVKKLSILMSRLPRTIEAASSLSLLLLLEPESEWGKHFLNERTQALLYLKLTLETIGLLSDDVDTDIAMIAKMR